MNEMMIINLPEVIFQLIRTFISNDDYHYFLNTSKKHFTDLKRRTIFFPLNKTISEQYLKDKDFQSLLLSKVEDGWKQIKIFHDPVYFRFMYDPTVPHLTDLTVDEIFTADRTKLRPFPLHVKELTISKGLKLRDVSNASHLLKISINQADFLEDISPLQNVPDLTFQSCPLISNFSMLNGQHQKKLTIINCKKLINVSSFDSIRIIVIKDCFELQNISPLYGVYDLTIIKCPKIFNIADLGGHYRFHIADTPVIGGYEALVGVSHVILHSVGVVPLQPLQYAKSVEIRNGGPLGDVSYLKKVKKVALLQCLGVENILELQDIPDLTVTSNLTVDEIKQLRNPRLHLTLPLNDQIIILNNNKSNDQNKIFLPNTKDLTISGPNCYLQESFFKHLQSLTIQNSNLKFDNGYSINFGITMIVGLEDIPTVRLIGLSCLWDITGLGRNHEVELRDCPSIQDVSSLANVSIVKIVNCKSIYHYNALSKVPRLKIVKM